MKDYLLEIGTEEIPARFMSGILNNLKEKLGKGFQDNDLAIGDIEVYGTYRRLTVFVKDIPQIQEDVEKELFGPPENIAKNDKGEWTQAAIGFAKRGGITLEKLQFKNDPKGRKVLYTKNKITGQKTSVLLPALVKNVIMTLNLPIAMRWGNEEKSFVRPIHWLVSIFGSTVIPFDLFGIKAANISYGHRFLTKNNHDISSGQEIKINSSLDYLGSLKKVKVIVNQNKRREIIKDFLGKELKQVKFDQNLLEEVVYLCENPVTLTGQFDKKYLDLPDEVLVQCMKKHQKYFPVYKSDKLTNQFVVVADNVTKANQKTIVQGNENVLIARLEDVKFFWDEDKKHKLESYVEKLKGVVFQKNLGTIWDKKERIKKLALYLADELGYPEKKTEIILVSDLCKADLVTQMVFELPALQGIMGSKYASARKEKPEVAKAIFEHYLPRFEGDDLPKSIIGRIVAIADRIDTMVCCFENGLIPTGSKDPWGIRRLMLAVLQILKGYGIKEGNLFLNLLDVITESYNIFEKNFNKKGAFRIQLETFFKQRIKGFIQNQGANHDSVESILENSLENPLIAQEKAVQMDIFRQTSSNKDKFKLIVDTGVRISRLAKNAKTDQVNSKLFKEKPENRAWQEFEKLKVEIQRDIQSTDILQGLEKLAVLSKILEIYFDNILVMAKDPKIKVNRLAFLNQLNKLYSQMADFEKLVV